jgi:NAD(P)-dependent dehydrogenase (short-subunit alcohol dehydrogenase family)
MKDLQGKVAVVTGAASGLGRAMAKRFAREGMKIVLADIDEVALRGAAEEISAQGTAAIAVRTDVSKGEEVERLAQKTLEAFDAAHLVVNNAGVAALGSVWENSAADWQWALGVNLWGVIHGVRVFAPLLLAQNEGHIVNTSSVAGLISPPGMGVYNVTKHAVVALTETLHHDLARRATKVRCSVLCPAYVPTGIADSERNRPAELRDATHVRSPERRALEDNLRDAVQSGRLSADDIAEAVLESVLEERFYILTHARIDAAIRARMEDILSRREPRDPLTLK